MKAETAARRSCRVSRLRLMMADCGEYEMTNNAQVINKPAERISFDMFDMLPRPIRDALNYSAFNYAGRSSYEFYFKGRASAEAIAEMIIRGDKRRVEKQYVKREAESLLKELGL